MEGQLSEFVSVIIPVFNDSRRLRRCLEALEHQTYPQHLYQVIVVDNGSDEAESVAAAVAQFQQAIVTFEATPGSYAARNKGITLAKGEIIAFTDADCIPASDWLEQGIAALRQTPNCGLAVGRINLFFEDPNRATLVELYESVVAFPQEEYVEKFKGGATANLFTFKRVIDQVGLFNTKLKSGGDLEWGRRVHALGYQQVYANHTNVTHPARSSFEQLFKKTKRVAGGVYDLYVQQEYSFLRKTLTFLRLVFDDIGMTLTSILKILQDRSLQAYQQKIGVSLIALTVAYIKIREKTRLQLGGVSSRG